MTIPPRTQPPFRADHVGSLLRPKPLQEARAAWKAGTLDAAALKAIEDRSIAAAEMQRLQAAETAAKLTVHPAA